MKLFSEVNIIHPKYSIQYKDKLFFIGSCFSNEISQKFTYYGYQLLANPFGTVYNPSAILSQLRFILEDDFNLNPYLVNNKSKWVSLLQNTDFSHRSKDELIEIINKRKQHARAFLKQVDFCFITLGTSTVFRHVDHDLIVANNQKLPAKQFAKESLSIKTIKESLLHIYTLLKNINPNVNIILTVSPVRYAKLGFHQNQLSKSRLLLAIDEFMKTNKIHYFPSYEIVLDELRDYRYFADDYMHLNSLGVNYVWSKVIETFLDPRQKIIRKKVVDFRKLQNHRVIDEGQLISHQQLITEANEELMTKYKIFIK